MKTFTKLTKIFLICLSLLVSIASSNPINATTTYPITIKMANTKGELVDKTFTNETEPLGFPQGWAGRSDWTYRTYRTIFLGWSTQPKPTNPTEPHTPQYRDTSIISSIDNLTEQTVLYPVFLSQDSSLSLAGSLSEKIDKLTLNKNETALTTFDNAAIKLESGFGDNQATSKSATLYYDSNKEAYPVHLTTELSFLDNRIPALLVENPLSLIKSAHSVTDFSGQTSSNYSYFDLKITLDNRLDVSTELTNLELSSPLLMVGAVLDENYNALESTIAHPVDGSLISKFSFKNPNQSKTFIIRTILRNYGADYRVSTNNPYSTVTTATEKEVFGDITLNFGDLSNIKISKAIALSLVENTSDQLTINGQISGKLNWDFSKFDRFTQILLSFMAPDGTIKTKPAHNTLNIKFDSNYVTFDKNSTTLGDTDTNQIIKENVKVAHNNTLSNDDLINEIAPENPTTFEANQITYQFINWNTLADGSGDEFDPNTSVVTQDITVYAQWQKLIKTQWIDKATGLELKPSETGLTELPQGLIPNYIFEETTKKNSNTLVTHLFTKEITTQWIDKTTGNELKPAEIGKEELTPGTIPNYIFEETIKENDNTLIVHYFTKQLTTKWVDQETNVSLKDDVIGKTVETAGDIEGYEFVTTIVEDTITTHLFKKVEQTPPEENETPVTPNPSENENPTEDTTDETPKENTGDTQESENTNTPPTPQDTETPGTTPSVPENPVNNEPSESPKTPVISETPHNPIPPVKETVPTETSVSTPVKTQSQQTVVTRTEPVQQQTTSSNSTQQTSPIVTATNQTTPPKQTGSKTEVTKSEKTIGTGVVMGSRMLVSSLSELSLTAIPSSFNYLWIVGTTTGVLMLLLIIAKRRRDNQ